MPIVKKAATPIKILYADDDSDDRSFLNESIQASGLNASVVCVTNGQEAIDYLKKNGKEEGLPSLIILDLNMPKLDGKQTLTFLKSHTHFASIPVVILSTSDNKAEKEYCTRNGALSYFTKPYHANGYSSLINTLSYIV